jgi:hypothetical protein
LPSGAAQDATLTGGTQKTKLIDTGGTNVASVSAAGALKVDGSATTQPVNNAQVNGSAWVTSATGIPDVMPRLRAGSTALSPNYTASRITTNTTTTVTAATAYVTSIVIVVSGAGSAWTVKVQNKEGTPKILYPATTAVLGASTPVAVEHPILATSGIDIVTAGTTPGTVDVFVTYWQ